LNIVKLKFDFPQAATSIILIIVMQKSQPVFEPEQQSKFQQLQLEIAALEAQVENTLKEQLERASSYNSPSPIPLIYVSDRFAQSGIRLAQEKAYQNC
jgi:hypothetical protein